MQNKRRWNHHTIITLMCRNKGSTSTSVYGHFGPNIRTEVTNRSDAATSVLCSVTSVTRCQCHVAAIQRRIEPDPERSTRGNTIEQWSAKSTHVVQYTGANLSSFAFPWTWSILRCLTTAPHTKCQTAYSRAKHGVCLDTHRCIACRVVFTDCLIFVSIQCVTIDACVLLLTPVSVCRSAFAISRGTSLFISLITVAVLDIIGGRR